MYIVHNLSCDRAAYEGAHQFKTHVYRYETYGLGMALTCVLACMHPPQVNVGHTAGAPDMCVAVTPAPAASS